MKKLKLIYKSTESSIWKGLLSMHEHFNAIFMNRIRYMFDAANRFWTFHHFPFFFPSELWQFEWITDPNYVLTKVVVKSYTYWK